MSITMDDEQKKVRISWEYESVPILSKYLVEILSRDGNWYVAEDECNGLNRAII